MPMTIEHVYRRPLGRALAGIAALGIVLLAVWLNPDLRFRLPTAETVALHTLLEVASIVVSMTVFSVSMHFVARERVNILVIASTVFVGVGLLDFVHLLTYQGMPVLFQTEFLSRAIAFFLAARMLAALALLAIALVPAELTFDLRAQRLLLAAALLFAAAIGAIGIFLPEWLPVYLIPGQGLTPAKIISEYVIIGLNVAAAAAFFLRMRERQPFPVVTLFAATAVMALSELLFTLYAATTDQFIHLAHLYKVIAYALIYRAVFVENIRLPYERLRISEIEVRRSRERIAGIVTAAMDAIISIDENRHIVLFNASAERMFGHRAEDMLGKPLDRLIPSRFHAAHADHVRRFGDSGESSRAMGALVPIHGLRSDGQEFPLDASISRATVDGKTVLTVILRDISERVRIEQELRELNEKLELRVAERTRKLEAANQELKSFSYTISHDLQAPLRAIDGYTHMLEEDLGATVSAEQSRLMEKISTGAKRMSRLINDVLAYSRLTQAHASRSELDLDQMVKDIVAEFAEQYPATAFEIGPLGAAHGDPVMVRQIFANLIGNACKYSSSRAAPTVKIGVIDGAVRRYCVRDNGIGFDMAYAQNLFGMFRRLHSDATIPGNGVGLAIVKKLVEQHNGMIAADAVPGEGASFTFSLGAAQAN